ncbi:zf-PARP-domain-containing protein [Lepidopterella palustris CBS 459.81]|uniref:Zf-PARP-domain-containing protein n=1 Tax=Lepidopterella palustris CBS 459.81 TaxID=1314670 RepID=A0A8E2ELM9_9PEZI|nr:zf-PARP-domain-containing protein [Lepidopterella palustris CBS 459.81]
MPGSYRVEIAKQGRAGCKGTDCKKAGTKINSGEFRFGSLVTVFEHTSWTWKHWGCVTPVQISNWKEATNGEVDLVDGYDELPEKYQAKVRQALEQGHVADEDWRGDVEMNRPGMKGMHVKSPKPKKPRKKSKKEEEDDEENEEESPTTVKPAAKKRGRSARDSGDAAEEGAPAAKKAKGKAKKPGMDEVDDDKEPAAVQPEAKPTKARASKKVIKADANGEEEPAEEAAPKPKKARAPKKALKEEAEGDEEPTEEAVPKPKKVRATKKAKAEPVVPSEPESVKSAVDKPEAPVKAKRVHKKKGAEEAEKGGGDGIEGVPVPPANVKKAKTSKVADKGKPAPQKRSRKNSKKTATEEEE